METVVAVDENNRKVTKSAADIRPAPLHWRIKLYELEDEGSWIDKGTGFVHCKVISGMGGPVIVIRSEENDGVIFFQSKVQYDDVYEIQGDNIIMWREPDAKGGQGVDYALSFQESAGCSAIWEQIASFQRQFRLQERALAAEREKERERVDGEHVFAMPESPHSGGTGSGTAQGQGHSDGHAHGSGGRSGFGIGPILSILELSRSPTNSSCSNSVATSHGYTSTGLLMVLPVDFDEGEALLPRIRYKLENLYPAQREFAVCQLLNDNGAYMKKLFRMFDKLEARRDTESLRIMADIFRAVLLLNNPDLIEHLVATDDTFRHLCGVMEYDRTLRVQGDYRAFMFQQARRWEVVPLERLGGTPSEVEEVRSGCTVLYRLRYVRDILLHPKIDDPGITAIGSMISFSSAELCTQMLQNTAYMARVLNVIWPALNIDNYLPAEAPALPAQGGSSPQAVSPVDRGNGEAMETGHRERSDSNSSSISSGEDVALIGPAPAVVRAAAAKEGASPVVTPPLGSPELPPSPTNSAAEEAGDVDVVDATAAQAPAASQREREREEVVANRPIDGLRFLRELFAMSKFLQVEKRVELFHDLFEKLQQPLFLVLNRVLVECRSPVATEGPSGGDVGAVEAVDASLFLPEERSVATQVVGEVLTALCIVCSPLLRQVVLGNPLPAASPFGAVSAAGVAASAAAGAAAKAGEPRVATPRTGSPVHGAGAGSGRQGRRWWEHNTLFLLIDGVVNSPDLFSIQSFGDVLKLVLDLEKAPSVSVKNDNLRFISVFYDHYLSYLLVPVLEGLDPASPVPASFYRSIGVAPHCACRGGDVSGDSNGANSSGSTSSSAQLQPPCAVQTSRRLIYETLVQCVASHNYRFKYFAMRNSILSKLLCKSFQHPGREHGESWLHLLGVKLVKAVLSAKDEFYYKHIEKLDLLRNMMLMFREIAHRDNLVTACVLDVFEDVRALGVKNLVLYIVDKYADCFGKSRLPQSVFERLKIKYDQIMDRTLDAAGGGRGGEGAAGAHNRYLTGARNRQQRVFSDLDSEEDYFFGDDDNSSQHTAESRGSRGSRGSAVGLGAGEDSHRDKRQRASAAVPGSLAASTIAQIVHGAFEGAEPPQSPMTSQNVSSHQRATEGGGGGRSLHRTTSLGRSGPYSDSASDLPSEAGSVLGSASQVSGSHHSQHSRSTTGTLRGNLMAMLGAYGIEDAGDDEEGGSGGGGGGGGSTGLTSHSVGKVQNIYDDDDGVSELSDGMDASGDEGEGWGRSRAGSLDSGAGTAAKAGVTDLYAGSDFVRASQHSRSPQAGSVSGRKRAVTEGAAEGGASNEEGEPALPLPPLKSRFDYDDDEGEGSSFLAALSAAKQQHYHHQHQHGSAGSGASVSSGTASASTSTSASSAANGKSTSGHISFSLKKKPKL